MEYSMLIVIFILKIHCNGLFVSNHRLMTSHTENNRCYQARNHFFLSKINGSFGKLLYVERKVVRASVIDKLKIISFKFSRNGKINDFAS